MSLIESDDILKKLKTMTLKEKEILAHEIRAFILENVSNTGGHLSSNLGVVELTIALHSIFNSPKDKIIFDVGHQCYTHKILTGRKDGFKSLRKLGGISGFPKVTESKHDAYNTGHSSTSISVALGMAVARDLNKEDFDVIAVIGDGALNSGLAFEGINNAGELKNKMLVILNDNEMSIDKNVCALSNILTKVRIESSYLKSKESIRESLQKVPVVGEPAVKAIGKSKKVLKDLIYPNMFFDDLGFTYIGPIDGHDIKLLEDTLLRVKEIDGPVLLHVITKKGKGYMPAEERPDQFHSSPAFDLKTGERKKGSESYSSVFGDTITSLARNNEKIVAITAAMKDGVGLGSFFEEYPNRFFDVGISEGHALTFAGGLAISGHKPFVAIYSTFLQRAYDNIIHDVCLMNLPVVICIDRAGIVGNDGETHQGIFDLSYLNAIPNLTVMAPKNFNEFRMMLEFASSFDAPIAIRYPRGGEGAQEISQNNEITLGKAELLREGKDISIIALGKMVPRAIEVSNILKEKNIAAEVINARFLKPLDDELITSSARKTRKVITLEDNVISGGFGSNIVNMINSKAIDGIMIKNLGYPDSFISEGSIDEIEKIYKLDAASISNICEELANRK